MHRTLAVALSVLTIVASAQAQAVACPRPAIAPFVQLVGEWTVAWDARVNDTLVAVEHASATVAPTNVGCAVLERLEGSLRGRAIGLTTVISAPAADSLELAYVDSDHGAILIFEGDVHGGTIRFSWSRDLGTRRLMVRREYSGITAVSYSTHTYMSPNSGHDWILVQRARYERTR